jgi:hypothetical protein
MKVEVEQFKLYLVPEQVRELERVAIDCQRSSAQAVVIEVIENYLYFWEAVENIKKGKLVADQYQAEVARQMAEYRRKARIEAEQKVKDEQPTSSVKNPRRRRPEEEFRSAKHRTKKKKPN